MNHMFCRALFLGVHYVIHVHGTLKHFEMFTVIQYMYESGVWYHCFFNIVYGCQYSFRQISVREFNDVFFLDSGTVLVASQNVEDLTQISSNTDQKCLPGKGDPLSALVSNANQQRHPECLLQRGKEELTTQPPHPINSFPQQGLSLIQERQNDSIVHTSTDPGKQVYQ